MDYEKTLYVEQAGPNGISLVLVKALFPLTNTPPPEIFGPFGSVWCKMAPGEVEVSLP